MCSATCKYTAPGNMLPAGLGVYVSGEIGHWYLGTSDSVLLHAGRRRGRHRCRSVPTAFPTPSYTTWNVGFGFTKSVFTLDLRYYDTNLSEGDCNAFTSDHTARFTGDFTPINTGRLRLQLVRSALHRARAPST